MKRPGLWIALALAGGLVAVVIVRAVQESAPEEREPTVEDLRRERGAPVALEVAERGDVTAWRSFHGNVSGQREAVVRARTDNAIDRVLVEVGDEVSRDHPLVRVTGDAIEAQRRQAQTAYRRARRERERLEPLHEEGAITDREWEEAVAQYEIARDDLAGLRENLELDSPLAGTVTAVPARPGQVPSPGDPLVRVADLSALTVTLRVGASAAGAIDVGQPARLPEREPEGEVSRVALQADPQTRLVEVEVAFPSGAPIVPGTLREIEIRTAHREDVVRVPPEAVSGDRVWVVRDDETVEQRRVSTGLETPRAVEITDGLEEGEGVVTRGAAALEDGMDVRVIESGDEAA